MSWCTKIIFVPLFLFVLFVDGQSAGAQVPDEGLVSIGFSNPNDIQPLRAYRLPTWSWSIWTLSADGHGDRRAYAHGEFKRTDYSASASLNPTYRGFWEGEKRTANLQFRPWIGLDRRKRESSPTSRSDQERDYNGVQVNFPFQGTIREYNGDRTFLLAMGSGRVDFRRDHREGVDLDYNSGTDLTSDVRLRTRLGVGVGRVRLVTPVIRALRIRERLRALRSGGSMSDAEVQIAARHLARRPGYQAVYDRPNKYFWRDLFSAVELADPSPFDLFYVANVLREPVGVRREGADIQAGVLGRYEYRLERDERDGRLTSRRRRIQGGVGGFAKGRWYRNLTLRHQLGAVADIEYTYFVERRGRRDSPVLFDQEVGAQATVQWLWVLADRVRFDTRAGTHLRYVDGSGEINGFQPRNRYFASSDLRIFVENHLSITVGGMVNYRLDGQQSGASSSVWETGLEFHIDYVLSRALE